MAGEALIGISITGWMTRPELFDEEILKRGAEIVKQTNKDVARLIGINPAARTTTVKPSGNAFVILKQHQVFTLNTASAISGSCN